MVFLPIDWKNVCKSWTFSFVFVDVLVLKVTND